MELLDTFKEMSELTNDQLIKMMEKDLNFKPPTDGGINYAFLKFTEGFEPRSEFLKLNSLMNRLLNLYQTDEGRKLFSGVKGFKDFYKGAERLERIFYFTATFWDWKVDAYIQYLRLKNSKEEMSPLDKATIYDLYIKECGNNEEGSLTPSPRELVLSSGIIEGLIKEEDELMESNPELFSPKSKTKKRR